MNVSVPGPQLTGHLGECVPSDLVQFMLVPAVYCLVLCGGLPGNLVALLVFLQSSKVRKAIRIYLINLKLADILFNLSLPLWISYYLAGGDWLLSEAACHLARATYYLATYSAVTFMALISFNRFCAVRAARRELPLMGRRGATLACALAWLLGLGCAVPALAARQTFPTRAGATACFEQHGQQRAYAYSMVDFFAAFLVVLGTYASIAQALSVPTAVSPGSHRQQARAMVLGMLLVFVVCVAPYHLTLAPWVGSQPPVPLCGPPAILDMLHTLSVALLSLNSCLDPLIYCFSIRHFRADLGRTLRKIGRCLPLSPPAPAGPVPSTRTSSFTSSERGRHRGPVPADGVPGTWLGIGSSMEGALASCTPASFHPGLCWDEEGYSGVAVPFPGVSTSWGHA